MYNFIRMCGVAFSVSVCASPFRCIYKWLLVLKNVFKLQFIAGFFFLLMNQNSINWIRRKTFRIKSLQYVNFAQ